MWDIIQAAIILIVKLLRRLLTARLGFQHSFKNEHVKLQYAML